MTGPKFAGRRFVAIASDYDGTLAEDGAVSDATLAALRRFKQHGGSLVLVTGRVLPELKTVFPELDVCDLVVAENGGLLYSPKDDRTKLLGEPPPPEFVKQLLERGVEPISVGACIVATWEPHDPVVLDTIREMQLDLSIIFNKGAVMILPTGVDKASGLKAALAELKLEAEQTIGFGDAENDLPFLKACGFSVAVANGLESVKNAADWTTKAKRGEGVSELLNHYLDAARAA